jgi:hypothetical protein
MRKDQRRGQAKSRFKKLRPTVMFKYQRDLIERQVELPFS